MFVEKKYLLEEKKIVKVFFDILSFSGKNEASKKRQGGGRPPVAGALCAVPLTKRRGARGQVAPSGARLRRPLRCAGHFKALSELKMAKFGVKAEAKKDNF